MQNKNHKIIIQDLKRSRFLFVVFSFTFFILSFSDAFAARIYFEPQPNTYKVGDSFTLSVILDTEGQSVNALDVSIRVPELVRIKNISKSGSIIQLWVSEPSFSGKVVTLTGGILGGTATSKGTIAKIVFQAAAVGEGNIALVPGSSVLLNDGQGTKLELQEAGGPLFQVIPRPKESIDASPESKEVSVEVKEKDSKKPEKFEIIIGTDPRVFGGEKFISFFTTDNDSGVDHYEVKIGKEPFKKAQSPYLIEGLAPRTTIEVRAYDDRGNYRESIYPGVFKRIWWKLITPFKFLL